MSLLSRTYSNGNNSNRTFAVAFPYLQQSHVKVFVGGSVVAPSGITWLTSSSLQLAVAPPTGTNNVLVKRVTPDAAALATIQAGSVNPSDINTDVTQCLFLVQEREDDITEAAGAVTALAIQVQALISTYPPTALPLVVNNPSNTGVPGHRSTVVGNTTKSGMDWDLDISGSSPTIGLKYGLGWSSNPGNNSGGADPRPDDVFVLGLGMGGNGAPLDITKGSCEWHIESYWYSFGYPGVPCWEEHWIVNGTNGVQYRPITMAAAHNGSRVDITMAGDHVGWASKDGTVQILMDSTGPNPFIQYTGQITHNYPRNNTATSQQTNSTGTGNLSYPYYNDHDFFTFDNQTFFADHAKFQYHKGLFFADLPGAIFDAITLNGSTPVTFTNTHLTAKSVLLFGMSSVSGTQGATPVVVGPPSVGSCSIKGTAGDNSTYFIIIFNGWTPP